MVKRQVDGQLSVFDADPIVTDVEVGSLEVSTHDGISVGIVTRAKHIAGVLAELSKYNQLGGFSQAGDPNHSGRTGIENRYDAPDTVIGRAEAAMPRHARDAKRDFAVAFGLRQMIDDGVDPEEARRMALESFSEILVVYGGVGAEVAKKRASKKDDFLRISRGEPPAKRRSKKTA